jgi:hypothetical protein
VKRSLLVVFGVALILLLSNRAFAEGAYQRTDDRKKPIVWNNDPRPGDAADAKVSEETEPEPPTEGPDETSAEVNGQTSAVSGSTVNNGQSTADAAGISNQPSTPLIAQVSEADESATPRQQPVTKRTALAPGAVRAIERPGRQFEKKVEKPKDTAQKAKKAAKTEETKAEPTTVDQESESPAEGPISARAEKTQVPKPKSTEQEPSQLSTLTSQPSADESPVDDSIRTLTGPPSSLHTKPEPVTTPAPESLPTIPAATSSSVAPKLNAVQAMDIADIEARTRGYDLGEYQLPKAEYNTATDTWSVSYIGREGDKKAKHLSVIVQDNSGKAEVKK